MDEFQNSISYALLPQLEIDSLYIIPQCSWEQIFEGQAQIQVIVRF